MPCVPHIPPIQARRGPYRTGPYELIRTLIIRHTVGSHIRKSLIRTSTRGTDYCSCCLQESLIRTPASFYEVCYPVILSLDLPGARSAQGGRPEEFRVDRQPSFSPVGCHSGPSLRDPVAGGGSRGTFEVIFLRTDLEGVVNRRCGPPRVQYAGTVGGPGLPHPGSYEHTDPRRLDASTCG